MNRNAAPAASQPISEWRYRFGPLQEREQKRQYASAGGDTTLAWVYTLVGADGKQLATYNGLQGALCGGNQATLQIWPVEFNAYGPGNTRLITRANGRTEYVVSDYLGSTRLLIDDARNTLQELSQRPFGVTSTSNGSGARTSYIGREHDNETDLGFFGVRLYEPEYGRFLSTDVLWEKYLPLQPYQYAGNEPVGKVDPTGLAAEDPKEVEETSTTFALGASIAGLGLGAAQIVAGVAACASPTGFGQVTGVALISNGVGMLCFSGAKLVDAVDALDNGRPASDIPSGYEELAGGSIDRAFGGDGVTGEIVGGILGGAVTGGLAAKALQVGSEAAPMALLPVIMEGLPKASGGLEFISVTHSIGTRTGLIDSKHNTPIANENSKDGRFESVLVQPSW